MAKYGRAGEDNLDLFFGLTLGILPPLVAEGPVIEEIVAANRDGLLDADGDSSDWFELYQGGPTSVDLSGWALTDDPSDLGKWRFPLPGGPLLEAGGYLVVFASGKDRVGEEWHTNFQLERDGEFLALVDPAGVIVDALAPQYPPQRADVSYGRTREAMTLVGPESPAEVWVPSHGDFSQFWTRPEFVVPAGWTASPGPSIGFALVDPPAAPPVGLIAYWPLDGILEDVVGGNDGVHHGGAPTWVAGHDGTPAGALDFDGVDDYVEVMRASPEFPLSSQPQFSVSLWARGGPQPDRRVFSEGSSASNTPVFNIGTDSSGASGRVDLFVRDNGGGTPLPHVLSQRTAFESTTWHHIAWVDDGGSAALYVDGVRDGTTFDYTRPNYDLNRTSIGAILRATDSFHFNGAIDDVSVWSRVLGDEEVARLAAGDPATALGSPSTPTFDLDLTETLHGVNASVYLRVPFFLDRPEDVEALTLHLRYDDGFIAYLNGVEVASANAPANAAWDSAATAERDPVDAQREAFIALGEHLDALRSGENILALHGLNVSVDDGEAWLTPRLEAVLGGPGELRYFLEPTPGGPNGEGTVDFVAEPVASHPHGFYEQAFELTLASATPEASVRYTTDGSEPTPSHGELYEGSLQIMTTTTLRALAYREGYVSSEIVTQTYIYPNSVLVQQRPSGYPTSWAGQPADYAMDPEIVDHAAFRDSMVDSLLALPSASIVLPFESIFGPEGIYQNPLSSGRAWERAASLELIDPNDPEAGFQIDAGVRITGNRSRGPANSPKHGFRFIFRGDYGAAKLEYPLFDGSQVDRFDTIVIKPNAFDSWVSDNSGQRQGAQYIRDPFVRELQRAAGHPTSHGLFVHLYLNGIYWGVHNLGERPDASFGAEHFGGRKEDWDAIKNHEELVDGTLDAYRALDALRSSDLSGVAGFESYSQWVDVDNFIDYLLINFYAPAVDWPGNYYMLRERRTGAGFKFVAWDSEYAFNEGVEANRTLPHWRDADSPTKFYHAIRGNAEFQVRMSDHIQRHFFDGGMLTPEGARASWLALADRVELALLSESARWGDYRRTTPYRPDAEWAAERQRLLNDVMSRRSDIVVGQLRAQGMFPSVAAPQFSAPPGRVARGTRISVDSPEGTTYFTVDGSDPRQAGGGIVAGALTSGVSDVRHLVAAGADARVSVPSHGSDGLTWTAVDFDDSEWTTGPTGVGFDRTGDYSPLIGLDVGAQMDGLQASVYVRLPFSGAGVGVANRLLLRMRYEDGFVAYLNGREVARRNAPESPAWDSSATGPRADADAVTVEEFDITEALPDLRAGDNVLAVHGMNSSPSSSDCLVLPELVALETSGEGYRVDHTVRVRARTRAGGEWSPLREGLFVVDTGALRVSELMYNPPFDELDPEANNDDFEFIEFQNVGAVPLALSGVRLSGAVEFTFGDGGGLVPPGGFVLVVKNRAAFERRYGGGLPVAGEYDGNFSNGGETLLIEDGVEDMVVELTYSDTWFAPTDGFGLSLEVVDPSAPPASLNDPSSWTVSEELLGTPGRGRQPAGDGARAADVTLDGVVDLGDAVRLLWLLFVAEVPSFPCGEGEVTESSNRSLADSSGNGVVDLGDVLHLLNYLFLSGPPPAGGSECAVREGCPPACP